MGEYNFSYELPKDFANRVIKLLQQTSCNAQLAKAFMHCEFEYEDLGLAYYAGLRGDNWNKHALDFTFEGASVDIGILQNSQSVLEDAMTKGLRPSVSGFLIRKILFLVNDEETTLLPSNDEERLNADFKTANLVLNDLVKISERLSTNATYRKETPENNINDYIRDALLLMGYNEAKDQTRHGISLSGKDAGEVDILISKDGKENAIFEGLKLSYVDSAYIEKHILNLNYSRG